MRTVVLGIACGICLTNAVCAADEVIAIRSIGAEDAQFVSVTVGERTTVIPSSLAVQSGERPALSVIVQRGMGIDARPPYFANVTLSYGFVTDQERLEAALDEAAIPIASATVVQSMRYTSFVGVWDSELNAYSKRPLDGGNTSFAGSLAGAFEIEFRNGDELAKFFQHPHPLILVTETQPDVSVTIARDASSLDRIVKAAIASVPLTTAMPLTRVLSELLKSYGGSLPFREEDLVAAIASRLSSTELVLGKGGRLSYVLPEENDRPSSPLTQGSQIQIPDRIASSLLLDLCGDDSSVLLIDIGKTGCDALDELLELEQ